MRQADRALALLLALGDGTPLAAALAETVLVAHVVPAPLANAYCARGAAWPAVRGAHRPRLRRARPRR